MGGQETYQWVSVALSVLLAASILFKACSLRGASLGQPDSRRPVLLLSTISLICFCIGAIDPLAASGSLGTYGFSILSSISTFCFLAILSLYVFLTSKTISVSAAKPWVLKTLNSVYVYTVGLLFFCWVILSPLEAVWGYQVEVAKLIVSGIVFLAWTTYALVFAVRSIREMDQSAVAFSAVLQERRKSMRRGRTQLIWLFISAVILTALQLDVAARSISSNSLTGLYCWVHSPESFLDFLLGGLFELFKQAFAIIVVLTVDRLKPQGVAFSSIARSQGKASHVGEIVSAENLPEEAEVDEATGLKHESSDEEHQAAA